MCKRACVCVLLSPSVLQIRDDIVVNDDDDDDDEDRIIECACACMFP